MTRDKVMALTDEEPRIKAAKLMGAQWFLAGHGGCRLLTFGRPVGMRTASGDETICTDACRDIPDYPNDIAAAWELVDFAKIKGYSCVIYGPGGLTDECLGGGPMWKAQFQKGRWCDEDGAWYTGEDKDLCSRAITRAFILAMTEGDK